MATCGSLVGYARCSTDQQDVTAQQQRLGELGVVADRIYLDLGLTGTNRTRPGLDQALAAVRSGDTLVVPKLDRLARSVPDARAIGDDLAARGTKLSLGGHLYDPTDPMGKMFFSILATLAEFEVELLRLRTREGMAVARAKGRLKGRQPKLSPKQQKDLRRMYDAGDYTITDLAEVFGFSRPPRLPNPRPQQHEGEGVVTAESPPPQPDPDDPAEILALLPDRWHDQFLAEYRSGLDAAREVGQWPRLRTLLHRWRLRATAYTNPGFDSAAQAARRAGPEDLVPLPGWDDRQ